jgi:hypothetical protein
VAVYKAEASNTTVTYNSVDITAYCNQADLEGVVSEIDGTNLASVAAESEPGSTNWNVRLSGMLEKASDDVIGKDALTPPSTMRNLVITVGPTGTQTTYTWTGGADEGAFINNYAIQPTEPTQLINWTAELGISGGPTRS